MNTSLAGGDEAAALRRCLSDVVAFSTLSAVWTGAARAAIAESLATLLQKTLDADAVYVALRATGSAAAREHAAGGGGAAVDQVRAALASWLQKPGPAVDPPPLPAPFIVTPIGIHAEHGVIVTSGGRDSSPFDAHRLLLNIAANQATVALATDRAREEQHIADTLQRIGTVVAAELDPEKVIQAVTDEATALTGASFGAFFYNVVNAAGESYMLYTLSGAPRDAFSKFPMPRNTAIFAPTFAGTSVVRSSDITKDPRFGLEAPYHGLPPGHLPVRSYLAVPVISRAGKVYGGLFLGHPDTGVFLARHERLAVGLAAWAALAMDNGYLYAEAQRANMAKDEFLATLSHELRTPLNAIVGWLSMLRRPEAMSPSGASKAWLAIDRNTGALIELVEDLLDVSRIAMGRIRLADVDLDVDDVVRDAARSIEPKFADKRVALNLEPARRPCRVRGDVARLRQVVSNLLSNALKFTGAGGTVTARVVDSDDRVTLSVEDTGIGIHPDFLPHVFERFRQGQTDTAGGLGLGLAIVRNLVELHGGTVTAHSDGIGRGARFTVTLPRARAGASYNASEGDTPVGA